MSGTGVPGDPWVLTTPLGTSQFEMHRDEAKGVLHWQVGSTWLHYQLRALDDLHAMLVAHGDWMELGNKDESERRGKVEFEKRGRGVWVRAVR